MHAKALIKQLRLCNKENIFKGRMADNTCDELRVGRHRKYELRKNFDV